MEHELSQPSSLNHTFGFGERRNSSLFSNRQTRQIPSEDLTFKVIKLICYCLVFIIGVVGNILVFRIVIGKRRLRTVGNFFICNLAAADIAVLTINLPFRLAYQENAYVWPFGSFLCKIIPTLTYLFITASSATLVLMSFDKHRALVHPLKRRFSIKKTKVAILFIWLVSVLVTLPFNIVLKLKYVNDKPICTDNWPSIEFERMYFIFLVFVQFVTPMTIISTTYISMCVHLRKTELNGSLNMSANKRRERNRKVIKMLIVIVVVYAAFTLPWHVTWLLSVYGYSNSVAKKLCVLLVIGVSAAHPIIYGTLNKDFARGFRGYTSCACKRPGSTSGYLLKSRHEKFERRAVRKPFLKDAQEEALSEVNHHSAKPQKLSEATLGSEFETVV